MRSTAQQQQQHSTRLNFNDVSNLSMQSGDESMLNFRGNLNFKFV